MSKLVEWRRRTDAHYAGWACTALGCSAPAKWAGVGAHNGGQGACEEHEALMGVPAELRGVLSGDIIGIAFDVPPVTRNLADECGALRTERDDLLKENAALRRKIERLERKR